MKMLEPAEFVKRSQYMHARKIGREKRRQTVRERQRERLRFRGNDEGKRVDRQSNTFHVAMIYIITVKVAEPLRYFSTDVVHVLRDGMTRHLLLPYQGA